MAKKRTPEKRPTGASSELYFLSANITICRKSLPLTNSLAYFGPFVSDVAKRFILLAAG
jgi:hypothetical protein